MKIKTSRDGDLIARISFDPYEVEVVDEDRYPGGFEGMDYPAYELRELPEKEGATAKDGPRDPTPWEVRTRVKSRATSKGFYWEPERRDLPDEVVEQLPDESESQ